jgi:hypothetical protein
MCESCNYDDTGAAVSGCTCSIGGRDPDGNEMCGCQVDGFSCNSCEHSVSDLPTPTGSPSMGY